MSDILLSKEMVSPTELSVAIHSWLQQPGRRFGYLTARPWEDSLAVEVLLLDTKAKSGIIFSAPLPPNLREYPSVTAQVPAAHWAERVLGDFFGIRAKGHPRRKSIILHDNVWPAEIMPFAIGERQPRKPYAFLRAVGEGIHEIPVGPIHAGIIEPGHFRFSCMGEIIANLEIRLGYQHRGVEKRLVELPWQQMRFVAESASSDTAIGNALAHAVAMEQLLGVQVPVRAQALRTIALELERLANHVGDLGAISGDIGYSSGASLFPPMRGACLALAQLLSGSRRQRYYVLPGGVFRDLTPERRNLFAQQLRDISKRFDSLIPLVLENPDVIDRMQGVGKVSPTLAEDFGLVGPAARASGSDYDARLVFSHGNYPVDALVPAKQIAGDVLARTQIRAQEIRSSIEIISKLIEALPEGPISIALGETLASNAVGVGIVEAWRGELIHWITTDNSGKVIRYAIKDPSLNNWTGLSMAVRNNLVADFPLCNKSFNLSYCGNDL